MDGKNWVPDKGILGSSLLRLYSLLHPKWQGYAGQAGQVRYDKKILKLAVFDVEVGADLVEIACHEDTKTQRDSPQINTNRHKFFRRGFTR